MEHTKVYNNYVVKMNQRFRPTNNGRGAKFHVNYCDSADKNRTRLAANSNVLVRIQDGKPACDTNIPHTGPKI